MVDVPTDIEDIEDLRPYEERQQIAWINQSYQERTNWLAQGSIRGGGEFVRSGFSDAHFPLELIQNADDEEATAIRFERDGQANQLRVYDNGDGFDLEGVVAVCQQGRSPKQSDKQIGFMGIGFKSLFEVCNRVEIHSKSCDFEYHFEFRIKEDTEQEGAPGFLVPEWIETPGNVTPYQPNDDDQNEYTTAIIGHLSDADTVTEPLQTTNLSPSVFLFLNHLKTVRIRDNHEKVDRTLGGDRGFDTHSYIRELQESYQEHAPTRSDTLSEGDNSPTVEMRELSENGDTQQYILFRNVWHPGDVERPQFRENLDQSELFVALRVSEDGEICESEGSIRISPIHSYLPIKQFDGLDLDFVLHADFDLSLNRQGVQRGSPWNEQVVQELRQQVLEPVAKTIAEHNSLYHQLEFIIPGKIKGDGLILNDLLSKFTERLRSLEIVRTTGTADRGFVQPTNATVVTDAVAEQFSSEEIYQAVGEWPVIESQQAVLERLNEDSTYTLRSVLKNDSDGSFTENKNIEWFKNTFREIIDEMSHSDIDDLSPEDVNLSRTTGRALKGNIIPTQEGAQASGEGSSSSPFRGIKIPPQSGYDSFDADDVSEVISSPVADKELFSGEHGDLIRQLFNEAGADELTTAEILVNTATEESIDKINIIMQAYANNDRFEPPTKRWFRDVDWREIAEPSLLRKIRENPEPEEIVSTVEVWVSQAWKRIPATTRRKTLQYLFTSSHPDVEQFEGITIPDEEQRWVRPKFLLFPPEFEPDYEYQTLCDEYPQVMSSEMKGFVDPSLVQENVSECKDFLKKIGVCNEEVNTRLSGKIGEEFVKRRLEKDGIDLVGLHNPEGRDFEDICGNCYEVKSSTSRKGEIKLDGPQAERINNAVGAETDYTLITVAYSLTPERTEIQDEASAEDVVSQRDTIVYKP